MSDLSTPVDCPSDLRLDRLLADELSEGARAELNAHLATCQACRARREDFASRRAAYLTRAPSFDALTTRVELLREGRARASARESSWARAALLALSAAAVALLALRLPLGETRLESESDASHTPALQDELRPKGGPSLGYYIKRGEQVVPGESGHALRPFDLVRFTYTSARPQQLALFNRDGRGTTVYYPPGTRSAPIAAGESVPLDFSVELDDYVGSERVLAVFCERPFELEPLRRAFEGPGEPRAPAGCALRSLELLKEPAP